MPTARNPGACAERKLHPTVGTMQNILGIVFFSWIVGIPFLGAIVERARTSTPATNETSPRRERSTATVV